MAKSSYLNQQDLKQLEQVGERQAAAIRRSIADLEFQISVIKDQLKESKHKQLSPAQSKKKLTSLSRSKIYHLKTEKVNRNQALDKAKVVRENLESETDMVERVHAAAELLRNQLASELARLREDNDYLEQVTHPSLTQIIEGLRDRQQEAKFYIQTEISKALKAKEGLLKNQFDQFSVREPSSLFTPKSKNVEIKEMVPLVVTSHTQKTNRHKLCCHL